MKNKLQILWVLNLVTHREDRKWTERLLATSKYHRISKKKKNCRYIFTYIVYFGIYIFSSIVISRKPQEIGMYRIMWLVPPVTKLYMSHSCILMQAVTFRMSHCEFAEGFQKKRGLG